MENDNAMYTLPDAATLSDPEELAKAIIKILDGRKGRNIRLLRVFEKTILADYFIICSGNSNTQIKALANEVEFRLGEVGINQLHTDGLPEATWVVMDYGTVLVHIFNRETRDFYNLEKLWQEAEEIDISGLLTED